MGSSKFEMKEISASSSDAEIEVRPGFSHLYFVAPSSRDVGHDIRKVGWLNYHKQRLGEGGEIEVLFSEFMDGREMAAKAIMRERLRLMEERSVVCTIQQPIVDLANRLVDVELSWEAGYSWGPGSAYLIFGAGRKNRMYPKSRSGDYVPSVIYERAMKQAGEAFGTVVADTTLLPLLAHAMARKT